MVSAKHYARDHRFPEVGDWTEIVFQKRLKKIVITVSGLSIWVGGLYYPGGTMWRIDADFLVGGKKSSAFQR